MFLRCWTVQLHNTFLTSQMSTPPHNGHKVRSIPCHRPQRKTKNTWLEIKTSPTLPSFKSLHKTCFYSSAFNSAWDCVISICICLLAVILLFLICFLFFFYFLFYFLIHFLCLLFPNNFIFIFNSHYVFLKHFVLYVLYVNHCAAFRKL